MAISNIMLVGLILILIMVCITLLFIYRRESLLNKKINSSTKMIDLSQYISNLDYQYAVLYKGLDNREIYQLEQKTAEKINIYTARLIDTDGTLHETTQKVIKLDSKNSALLRIIDSLKALPKSHSQPKCPPVFRDALAFYSKKNKIAGIIHFCFSCAALENEFNERFAVQIDNFSPLMPAIRDLK